MEACVDRARRGRDVGTVNGSRVVRRSLTIDPESWALLVREAGRHGMSISRYVRMLARFVKIDVDTTVRVTVHPLKGARP